MRPDRLDRRRLNRATLHRQLLLRRADLTVDAAVRHLVGLQSQAPLAHYVALWSRLEGFDPGPAAAGLQRGELVRTHLMRMTVHLVTREDALGVRALLQPMQESRFGSSPFAGPLAGVDLNELREVARSVATDAPLSRAELGRRLQSRFPDVPAEPLGYAAVYLEPMAQVPPRGVWGHRAPVRWQTYRGWLGTDAGTDGGTDAGTPVAVDDLLLRYLAAFGPATVADARVWSGLPALGEVADRLGSRVRRFLDDQGQPLLDLPDASRPEPDEPAPVRFLPEYDNVLLSHAERSRVIPDGRPVPLPPGDGARAGTVLVDGEFRATWRLHRRTGSDDLDVVATPPITSRQRQEVEDEGRRLLTLIAPDCGGEVTITGGRG
jgi:hypothetical protein